MERGYILHRRPYQESSLLVNLLVDGRGRVDAIARLGSGRRSIRSILQPCQPLIFSLAGKGELHTLSQIEPLSAAIPLQGKSLYSAMYLNELLMRTLSVQQSGEQLFVAYHQTLMVLASSFCQRHLRYFEKKLLGEFGCMPSLIKDIHDNVINGEQHYHYITDEGFILAEQNQSSDSKSYAGCALLRLAEDNLQDSDLNGIKHLMRRLLSPLLGNKPLVSRSFFIQGINCSKL